MVRDNPFPHIVWDSFLDKETLSSIEQEFPHEESDLWTWKSNDENSVKYMCQDQNLIKKLPKINNLIKYLNSSYFCSILGSIFKIHNLECNIIGTHPIFILGKFLTMTLPENLYLIPILH